MAEKRVSGWFLVSAVFILVVFGIFFTVTERRSWPEQRTELSASDMRLSPPTSTMWCEALAFVSTHPFVAYQVSHDPAIDPKVLTRQTSDFRLKLQTGGSRKFAKLRFYLLPSSVMEIVACSSADDAYVAIFKGDFDIPSCMQSFRRSDDDYASSEFDSDESISSEEIWEFRWKNRTRPVPAFLSKENISGCSPIVSYQRLPASETGDASYTCDGSPIRPLRLNVTTPDHYVVVVLNANRRAANFVALHLVLDRTRYTLSKTGKTFDMCSLATSCTIGLDFNSGHRAVLWIPEEPHAGRHSFAVVSQCKPRLALFAVLSVCAPLVMFLAVAYVVRIDRRRARLGGANGNDCASRDSGFVTPLLQVPCSVQTVCVPESPSRLDEAPPSYSSLYEQPPPYSSLKTEEAK